MNKEYIIVSGEDNNLIKGRYVENYASRDIYGGIKLKDENMFAYDLLLLNTSSKELYNKLINHPIKSLGLEDFEDIKIR